MVTKILSAAVTTEIRQRVERLGDVIEECQRLIEASENDFSFGAAVTKGVSQRILKIANGEK